MRRTLRITLITLLILWLPGVPFSQAQSPSSLSQPSSSSATSPFELNADNIEYDQVREVYVATGSVVGVRGPVQLTADQVTLNKLSGRLLATGDVHLRDNISDLWTKRLELNIHTETGNFSEGQIFLRETNSLLVGRHIQRFSETHYRAKDGSFTNCDAKDGEIPAWRFTFEDFDFDLDDSLYGKGVWFNINDFPVVPLPPIRYPLGGARKTGFLIPTAGIDNVFGFRYQHSFYWAINPSQDLTISPLLLSKIGAGGDLEYRYILDRQSEGEWLLSSIFDTNQPRSGALVRGAHVQRFNEDLSLRMDVNIATNRRFLNDFSNSGVIRALPSQQSNLLVNQRLDHGSIFLLSQYLQPLQDGGPDTFQRLPEIGHRLFNYPVFGDTVALGMDSTFVHWFREEGFDLSRVDLLPGLSTRGLHIGHVLGLRPQVKFREVFYTRGRTTTDPQNRETGWLAFEAFSHLSRRIRLGKGHLVRHTLEPRVIYEYVPPTKQSEIVQVDAVDDLLPKSLVTYSLRTRINELKSSQGSSTWLDLFLAQSYHVGTPPGLAKPFSDIWARARMKKPIDFTDVFSDIILNLDTFYDPNTKEFSQINTDFRLQAQKWWYLQLGQRFARSGTRVRRGDIWNPISFNEVLDAQDKIVFLTAGGAVRLPLGLTVGSRWYHDFRTGQTPELDIVGLYQNPCRCFSLGLYYIEFPDRQQFNFLLSLTGLFSTGGLGAQLMESILGPLMRGETGVPWAGTAR